MQILYYVLCIMFNIITSLEPTDLLCSLLFFKGLRGGGNYSFFLINFSSYYNDYEVSTFHFDFSS